MADFERPRKRRRTSSSASLTTPPALDLESSTLSETSDTPPGDDNILTNALHVLNTEAAALSNIASLYTTSPTARSALTSTISTILRAQHTRNKVIVSGVGKSAFIAQKFVATCKSLSISASFLHACEAVHGDLGDVRAGDVVVFVSFSGRTPELLGLLEHLRTRDVRVVTITGKTRVEECRLLDGVEGGILLPAPVVETEEETFGVAAPTTSTTVAMAVTDMLALTLAEEMHGIRKREVFERNHPGGAIGMKGGKEVKRVKKEVDVSILELPSPSISGEDDR